MQWGKILRDYVMLTLGAVVFALGFDLFLRPAGIAPGGLSGIALLVNALLPALPIGVLTLVFNIPLFFWGLRTLGGVFLCRTIYASVLLSVLLDLFCALPLLTIEPLLAAIYGGVLIGAGMGLAFLPNGSTGGLDIVIRILRERAPQLSLGQLMLLFDVLIVLATGLVYRSLNNALYSIITMYAASLVLDAILYGLQYAKAAFIITAKGDAVNRGIQEYLVRGTTCIPCTGGYSGQARVMILCAIKRGQIAALREAVSAADPDAFVILSEAHEVFGHGFQRPGKHAF